MLEDLDAAPIADRTLGRTVPVIDLGGARATIVRQIADACAEWGFFQIVGHDFDSGVLTAASAEARAFFAARKPEKRSLSRSNNNPWGFYDRELTKNARDKKEVYDIGPDASERPHAGGPFSGVTPWPAWQPAFEPTMRAYFVACERASADLLEMICAGLGLPPRRLHSCFEPSHTGFLRLNYYPIEDPLAGESGEKALLGIHHHTDAGALTLLLQDDVSGLQVFRDGVWYNVEPLPDAFVINIGDMIQVWSNDLYRAPIHRVLAMENAERRSLPFFYNPRYDAIVAPLKELVPPGSAPRYKNIQWGEFRRKRAEGDYADYGAEVQISDYRL